MKNTFDTLKEQAANAQPKSLVEAHVGDINYSNGKLQLKDLSLSSKSQKTFLNNIKFSDSAYKKLNKKIPEKDMINILGYFTNDKLDTSLYLNVEGDTITSISDIRRASFDNLQILETIEKLIKDNNLSVDIAETSFVNTEGHLKLDLTNTNFNLDIFKELEHLPKGYENDVFRFGTTIFNDQSGMNGSSVESFVQRLICANGMVTDELNYRARMNNKDPFNSFIRKIDKSISDEKIMKQFQIGMLNNIERLFTTEASIKELENVVNVFEKYYIDFDSEDLKLNTDKQNNLKELFQLDEVSHRYKENIYDMSERWKSTANTGMKLYDLMNISTFLISHNKLENLTLRDKVEINRDIMDTFFRKEYDLENVAPMLQIEDDILDKVRQKYHLN